MKLLSSVFVAFALSACSSVLPKGPPVPTQYTLSAIPAAPTGNTKPLSISLRILLPQAAPGLESAKIALRKKDNQLDYYADARWTGSLGSVIQEQLVQSFDATKQLVSVSNDLVAVNQDYSLLVEIRDFQIEYKGDTPNAHIRLTTKLIKAKNNKIIATRDYEENEPVKQDAMQQVITAFNVAYQRSSEKLVSETLQTLR